MLLYLLGAAELGRAGYRGVQVCTGRPKYGLRAFGGFPQVSVATASDNADICYVHSSHTASGLLVFFVYSLA